MVRRSAWARQSQSEKRGIRRKYSKFPQNPQMLEPWLINRKAKEATIKLNDSNAWAFLNSHKPELFFVMMHTTSTVVIPGIYGITENIAPKTLAAFLEDKSRCKDPHTLFNRIVSKTATRVWSENATKAEDVYAKHYQDFLRERKIPYNEKSRIDQKAFEETLNHVLGLRIMPIYGKGHLDAEVFEGMYILLRKNLKSDTIALGTIVNGLIKTAFHGIKMNPQLIKRKKALILDRTKTFQEKLVVNLKAKISEIIKQGKTMTYEEIMNFSIIEEEKFRESLLVELKKTAENLPKKKLLNPLTEEAKQKFNRKAELKQRAFVARKMDIPFDPVADSISRIRERIPAAAQKYDKLIKTRVLNKGQFLALHIHGTHAERIFLEAFENLEFQHKFGSSKANDLARIIAYIGGGMGHKKERVRNIDGPIYDFLLNHSYITLHTGGKVAYLSQPKTNGNGGHK